MERKDIVSSIDEDKNNKKSNRGCNYSVKGGIAMLLLWVVILFLISLAIIYFINPTYVSKPGTNEIEWGKASVAATVFALSGIILIWVIISCF